MEEVSYKLPSCLHIPLYFYNDKHYTLDMYKTIVTESSCMQEHYSTQGWGKPWLVHKAALNALIFAVVNFVYVWRVRNMLFKIPKDLVK